MKLKGSCQCGSVKFSVRTAHPVPYQRCYCSICRKQQGGGGYAINISGEAKTLEVEGRDNVTIYHARVHNPGVKMHLSTAERAFCKTCGSALWLFSPEWPELIHPFASAIDTDLPVPPHTTHLMLKFKLDWVVADIRDGDLTFDIYPEESIAEWHDRNGMTVKP